MVFVSIIIPFNKGERYLIDCLDSLVEQDLKDYEIILIVNGYENSIEEFIHKYNRLNIIIKSFDNELGVSKARNEGLKIANGEYVYFMDSDDYLYQDALSKLIDKAHKTHADLINGERINTVYIKDRIEEQKFIRDEKQLLKNGLNDLEYSMLLLVGTKTERLELMSALHCLIKKDNIDGLYFDESKRYFTDYDFMINAINRCDVFYGVGNAVYAKRIRDDAINLTSLNQEPKQYAFMFHAQNYWTVLEKADKFKSEKFDVLKSKINDKFLRYYLKKFAISFLNNQDKDWISLYFDEMSKISYNFNLDNLGRHNKKEINALRLKDKETLKSLIKRRARRNKLKKSLKKRWMFKSTVYTKYFNNRELKSNKILFESFYGKYYTDSPKYIYEYLYENYNDDYEFVWVLNKNNVKIPGNPKTVKRFSLSYYKHLAESKYVVFNTRHPKRLRKRNEQVFISTWHGTPLKRLGFDQGNLYLDDANSKKSYKNDSSKWDYMISPNRYTTEIYRSAFAYNGEIIELGYPRNDILYNADEKQIIQIKDNLNIPLDKKIILYAPTWRDDEYYDTAKVKFTLKLDLERLKKEFGDEYIIILRMHYFISDNINLKGLDNFVYDFSKFDDIAQLYLISDMLITDYSSVFFDYANLKRPILFFTYDLDKYENILRGFYIDIHNEVPGPLLMTNDEVIDSIRNIDDISEKFHERYEKFYNRFCYIDDGNASKRIVKKIWQKEVF